MNHIEKAYKAWRATVKDDRALAGIAVVASRPSFTVIRAMTPSERMRRAVKSFWATLTPEQRSERQRKAAKKMWKRRKAERSA